MISEKQNEPKQIRRLAAARQIYSEAKDLFAVHAILSGPVAVLTAFIVMLIPSAKGFVALWGLGVVLLDIYFFTRRQKQLKVSAARIQEEFDCEVLEIPWNGLKSGTRPDAELVKEKSDDYEKKAAAQMPTLLNWYSTSASELPLHIGRIACQRSNCWWDSKQRRRYAGYVTAGVIGVVAFIITIAIFGNLTIEECILKVVAPLAPVLVLGIRQGIDQSEAAERLDKLKDHSKKLWDEALAGAAKSKITKESRNLQDEIFENRRRSPLVFDWIFKHIRTSYEAQMNHSVNEMVAEAKSKLSPQI